MKVDGIESNLWPSKTSRSSDGHLVAKEPKNDQRFHQPANEKPKVNVVGCQKEPYRGSHSEKKPRGGCLPNIWLTCGKYLVSINKSCQAPGGTTKRHSIKGRSKIRNNSHRRIHWCLSQLKCKSNRFSYISCVYQMNFHNTLVLPSNKRSSPARPIMSVSN